jgi:hypothetical protein
MMVSQISAKILFASIAFHTAATERKCIKHDFGPETLTRLPLALGYYCSFDSKGRKVFR